MAEKNVNQSRRRTRKEYLLTRKQQQQFRQARLILTALVGVLVLILAAGAVYEYVYRPGQPVASVNGTEIPIRDFYDRVRLERQRATNSLDSLYDAVGGDLAQLQQFAGQQLNQLAFPTVMGEQVLFQMIDEELVNQEAERRGISISSAEIDTAIEERFNFYGGELPPEPDTGDEPEPTPTVTPIGAEEAEEEPETEPEPVPEPTAVSRGSI